MPNYQGNDVISLVHVLNHLHRVHVALLLSRLEQFFNNELDPTLRKIVLDQVNAQYRAILHILRIYYEE